MNRIFELAQNAVCIYCEAKSKPGAEVTLQFDNKEDASEFYDMIAYGLNNDGSVV